VTTHTSVDSIVSPFWLTLTHKECLERGWEQLKGCEEEMALYSSGSPFNNNMNWTWALHFHAGTHPIICADRSLCHTECRVVKVQMQWTGLLFRHESQILYMWMVSCLWLSIFFPVWTTHYFDICCQIHILMWSVEIWLQDLKFESFTCGWTWRTWGMYKQ
jgi:hypothetical protein